MTNVLILQQDAIVEWLLNYMSLQDLDASIVDAEGNTALHLASKYGHIGCVKVCCIILNFSKLIIIIKIKFLNFIWLNI